jgi:hypothetical protein
MVIPAVVPEITSLVFVIRIFAKELKVVLGDLFQIVEFVIRWWIFTRRLWTQPPTVIAAGPIA